MAEIDETREEARRNTRGRFEQWAKNPTCEANTISAVHNIRLDKAAEAVPGLSVSFGQSPFALARGNSFEAGLFYDETTRTLFCGDLFTQLGDAPASTTDDILDAASFAEDAFGATALTPQTGVIIRRLAELTPTTLAVMHGSCFTGDGSAALQALAANYDARLAAA